MADETMEHDGADGLDTPDASEAPDATTAVRTASADLEVGVVAEDGAAASTADADGEPLADGVEMDAPVTFEDVESPEDAAVESASGSVDGVAEAEGETLGRAGAEVKSIVEALIFASPEPLTPKALLKLLDAEPPEDVLAAIEALKVDYARSGGLQLVEVAGGYQIVTRPDLHEWVRRLFHERTTSKLSVQALEALAVIAYRQPVSAPEITEIRGVNTSGVLNTLLERHLIKIAGRKQVVGRPFLYATTKEFLVRFGLNDLKDLPEVEDMASVLGFEAPLLVEQTPGEDDLPLAEPDAED